MAWSEKLLQIYKCVFYEFDLLFIMANWFYKKALSSMEKVPTPIGVML